MRRLSALVLSAALAPIAAAAAERTHTLYLVNRAHDRIVAVATTPAGGTAWNELLRGATLAGGGDTATLQLASDQCVHDVKVEFVNGRRALYPALDLCRHRGLRIPPLPARDTQAAIAVRRDGTSGALSAED
ncbi:hypothetical protein [Pseudoxanthomonas sp.]|jgi:hypothetical protein|uniref:hypothetical protein n=1 Tax=Pseudoxanthomonas sp. TaxID=1871049 RepID=UPI002E0D2863|nr:hypothetical protein [Pseudoxanthomonas sp.]